MVKAKLLSGVRVKCNYRGKAPRAEDILHPYCLRSSVRFLFLAPEPPESGLRSVFLDSSPTQGQPCVFPGSSHQQDPTPISTAPDLPALQAEFQHDLLQRPHLDSSTPPSQMWSPILFRVPSAVGVSFKAPSFTYTRIPPFPAAGILPCSLSPHSWASSRQGLTRSKGSLVSTSGQPTAVCSLPYI